jgi:hypothetical protein
VDGVLRLGSITENLFDPSVFPTPAGTGNTLAGSPNNIPITNDVVEFG